MTKSHRYQDLIVLFEQTFAERFNTRLVKGGDEPIYLPADDQVSYHRIIFAHGYYASALHEISHWCIAGEARRLLEDFGYWYLPDGRDQDQQSQFEQVEVKPQAIEWAFCVAAGKPFAVSVDNLNGDFEPDRFAFQANVYQQVKQYLDTGFPARADDFIHALANFYQIPYPLSIAQFDYQTDLTSEVLASEVLVSEEKVDVAV